MCCVSKVPRLVCSVHIPQRRYLEGLLTAALEPFRVLGQIVQAPSQAESGGFRAGDEETTGRSRQGNQFLLLLLLLLIKNRAGENVGRNTSYAMHDGI